MLSQSLGGQKNAIYHWSAKRYTKIYLVSAPSHFIEVTCCMIIMITCINICWTARHEHTKLHDHNNNQNIQTRLTWEMCKSGKILCSVMEINDQSASLAFFTCSKDSDSFCTVIGHKSGKLHHHLQQWAEFTNNKLQTGYLGNAEQTNSQCLNSPPMRRNIQIAVNQFQHQCRHAS